MFWADVVWVSSFLIALRQAGQMIFRILPLAFCASAFTLALAPMSADAKSPGRHICDPEQRSPPQPVGVPAEPDDLAMQALGCLPRAFRLDPVREAGAQVAVRLQEEPGSLGAVYVYRTSEERRSIISQFAQRWADASVTSRLEGSFLGVWKLASVRLPDGSLLSALFEDKAASGSICLARANVAALKASRSVLGNWCMDQLRVWRAG